MTAKSSWKSLGWEISATFHERGWIHGVVGKAKTIVFTEHGVTEAERFRAKHLAVNTVDTDELNELEQGMWQTETRHDQDWLRQCPHPTHHVRVMPAHQRRPDPCAPIVDLGLCVG